MNRKEVMELLEIREEFRCLIRRWDNGETFNLTTTMKEARKLLLKIDTLIPDELLKEILI